MGRERPDCRPWEEGPAAGAQPYILCGESTAGRGRRRADLAPPSCLQAHATHIPVPNGPLSPLPCAGKVPHPIPHGATQHRHTTQGQGCGRGW